MAVNVSVSNTPGQLYKTTIQAGNHQVVLDVPAAQKGQGLGPTPHEMLLGSLGACTSMTMAMYANMKGWDLDEININLSETKVQDPNGGTRKIPHIEKTIEVKGNLDAQQLSSLKSIAERCPVNQVIMGNKTMATTLDRIV